MSITKLSLVDNRVMNKHIQKELMLCLFHRKKKKRNQNSIKNEMEMKDKESEM